jgi:hypothetical protein
MWEYIVCTTGFIVIVFGLKPFRNSRPNDEEDSQQL